MNVMKSFFKQKETLLGIAVAIAFQLIFFVIWLTAYDGVYDRTDQFVVVIVNEDHVYGVEMEKQLAYNSLFEVNVMNDMEEAKKQLDSRELNMIIHIPSTLTDDLQTAGETTIYYYINQSAPSLTKQMMERVAIEVNAEINGEVYTAVEQQMSEKLPTIVAAQAENQEMAQQVASQVIETVQENSTITPVQKEMIKTNDREGFAVTMIPLLVVLASYIGAMLMSQHLQFAQNKLRSNYHIISLFLSRQMINVMVAVTLSLITIGFMNIFGIHIEESFFVLWSYQTILLFSFLSLSQVFVILFGNPGMIFNIILVATQLVSSGAIVPRELLSPFYQGLGEILPATYGVNGYFSLLYGGGDLKAEIVHLTIIISVTLIIVIAYVVIMIMLERKRMVSRET